MAIKAHTAGSLSFTEIVAEWNGSTPHSLSEYYSGGSLVYSGATGDPSVFTTTIHLSEPQISMPPLVLFERSLAF